MKRKNCFAIVLIAGLLFGTAQQCCAQAKGKKVKIEALKDLKEINPFEISPEQWKSFDPQKGESLYFEDGSKISYSQFMNYLTAGNAYICVTYVNPSTNQINALLVRKATPEEKKIFKESFMETETVETAKADPNMTAEELIKAESLKKQGADPMQQDKKGTLMINKVVFFGKDGKQIPSLIKNDKDYYESNPAVMKLFQDLKTGVDAYLNKEGEVRVIVFRKATQKEIEQKKAMASRLSDDSGADVASNEADEGEKLLSQKAPAIETTDIKGNPISLTKLKGKVVVLNFWFIECKPCRLEMPELNKLVEKYKGKNVEFIALCNDDAESIVKFLKQEKFNYRQVAEAAGISIGVYNARGFPVNVVIDQESTVQLIKTGYSPGIGDELSQAIDKCLNK